MSNQSSTKIKTSTTTTNESFLIDDSFDSAPSSRGNEPQLVCSICTLPVFKQYSDVTRLQCGHVYHSKCAHIFLTRGFGRCKVCLDKHKDASDISEYLSDRDMKALAELNPSSDLLLARQIMRNENLPEPWVELHPIDWGDDFQTRNLLKGRLCIIKLVRQKESFANDDNIGNGSQSSQTELRKNADIIDAESFENFMKRQEELAIQQLTLNENRVSGSDSSILSANQSFSERLGQLLKTTVKVGMGADDSWLRADHGDVRQLFYYQKPIAEIAEKYNVTPRMLITKEFRVENLFERGYSLDDLLILGATWADICSMFLIAAVWKKHKNRISVKTLRYRLGVTIADVMYSVCRQNFDEFVSIGFTCEELFDLQANASNMVKFGMKYYHMPYMHLTMEQWVKYMNLSDQLMFTVLDIQPPFLFAVVTPPSNSSTIPPQQRSQAAPTLGWLTRDLNATSRAEAFQRLFPKYHTFFNMHSAHELLSFNKSHSHHQQPQQQEIRLNQNNNSNEKSTTMNLFQQRQQSQGGRFNF